MSNVDISKWIFISGTSNHDFDETVRKQLNQLLIGEFLGKSPQEIINERFPKIIKSGSEEHLTPKTIQKIKDALMGQLIEAEHQNHIVKWNHLDMRRFPDGEPAFMIYDYEKIPGKNVIIFQSIYDLPYENQTIDLIWACKKQYEAKKVILVAPFFRFRRQDHPEIKKEINRNLRFCENLRSNGLDEIILCEIHSQQTIKNLEKQGIVVHHIKPHALYAKNLLPIIELSKTAGKNIFLYSPDKGSVPRAVSVAREIKKLGHEISVSVTFKNRINGSQTEITENQIELKEIQAVYPDVKIFATDKRIEDSILIAIEDELATGGTAKTNGIMLRNEFRVYGLIFIAAHPVCTWGWKSKFIDETPFRPILLANKTIIGIKFGNTILRHYEKRTKKVENINFGSLFAEETLKLIIQ